MLSCSYLLKSKSQHKTECSMRVGIAPDIFTIVYLTCGPLYGPEKLCNTVLMTN